MNVKDQFRFVRQNMKKNKTRLFMTILATAIGCTFLIVLASVGFGLHKSIIQDVMEDSLVTEIQVHGKEMGEGNFQGIKDEDIKHFQEITGVKAVTRRQSLQQSPIFKTEDYTAQSEAVSAFFPEEVKAGFELSEGRLPEKRNEVVVGSSFADGLSLEPKEGENAFNEDGTIKEEYAYKGELVGKTIEMEVVKMEDGKEVKKSIPLTITGVTKKPSKEWMQIRTVFISEDIFKEVEAYTGTPGGSPEEVEGASGDTGRIYDSVSLYAKDVEAVTGINDKLKEDNYMVYSIVNEMKQINMVFTILKIGLLFIGTIALIIASIGIYNTMTMAVTERAPDIGIMKAIGAHPKTIKRIFVLESSYIGLLGALFGTIVAYGISYAVNLALPLVLERVFEEAPPEGLMLSYIPWSLTLISVAICLTVTIFSGWRPAKRATQVDVLKAMRREV
ncbi:ABC transporter permease [Cytobacillus firmus]|uniref:ABC transporter permease n=1 Tax=Cytobacillus firmus TaxID=1399 RepID=UPI001CFDD4D5|nr:FtsX-like permease family protein [Cytobacillus firmus]WHY62580.1 FtsX-like permease family protein [Cytobacillus firmus]